MERIIRIEVEGKTRLGFDTGLNSQAFAQAKLARFISRTGLIVPPDGAAVVWRPEGVTEYQAAGSQPAMVIWGPDFAGKRLDRLIEEGGGAGLDALRYWVQARKVLNSGPDANPDNRDRTLYPWPAAAILAIDPPAGISPVPSEAFPRGTVFFPPDRLIRRAVEAEGSDAWLKGTERWAHPDLAGEDAVVFAAAAMLYRILCGEPPYPNGDIEGLHSDMREGVYTPPDLMAPGLDRDIAALITRSLSPGSANTGRPSLSLFVEAFEKLIGPPLSGGPEGFFRQLSGEERKKIETGREQFNRKKTARVKIRRFIHRNTAIIGGVIIAMTALGFVISSVVKTRMDLPTTAGMNPREVITSYYGAIENLDHTLMEACTINKAGKGDIDTVTNIFVIGKVREAYEMRSPVIAAGEWLDSGAAPTELTVVGVTDLRIEGEDEDEGDGEVTYKTAYTLWLPAAYAQDIQDNGEPPETAAPVMPAGTAVIDEVRLVLRKGAWRIAGIRRETR
jgi:hypothetical protein